MSIKSKVLTYFLIIIGVAILLQASQKEKGIGSLNLNKRGTLIAREPGV